MPDGLRRAVGGSGIGQVCIERGDAAAGIGVHDQQLAALVHDGGGAKGSGQLVALGLVALKAGDQKLAAGGCDGHVQRSLWAAEWGLPLCFQL